MGHWQPRISGTLLELRPLQKDDFEPLFAVASDPKIWELHPERERYKREVFVRFFDAALASRGALLITDRASGAAIGSSRFTAYDAGKRTVEVGYTFLARSCWGRGYNAELKRLMLDHAFQRVGSVSFFVGEGNLRSRRAMEKIGAVQVSVHDRKPLEGAPYRSVEYRVERRAWTVARAGFSLPLLTMLLAALFGIHLWLGWKVWLWALGLFVAVTGGFALHDALRRPAGRPRDRP